MRLRRRKRNNWLREKTIARINEEHNGLFEKEYKDCYENSLLFKYCKCLNNKKLFVISIGKLLCIAKYIKSYICGSKGWWIIIILISLFLIFISPINLEFLNIIDIKYETAKELVNQRTSDLAAIFSIALVVVGFLLNSLAIKHSVSYKLLFKNAKIYFVVYYCLSLIAALIVLSSLRDSIDNVIFTKVFLAISYLALYGLFLIGKLFRNIIGMTSEDSIYESIGKEYIDNYVCELKENLLREKSKEIFKEEMEECGLKEYDYDFSYLNNPFSFERYPEIKTKSNKKRIIYDINLKNLKSLKKNDDKIKNYNQNIAINKEFSIENTIIGDIKRGKIFRKLVIYKKYKCLGDLSIDYYLDNLIIDVVKYNKIHLLDQILNNYRRIYELSFIYQVNKESVLPKIHNVIFESTCKAIILENDIVWELNLFINRLINTAIDCNNFSIFYNYIKLPYFVYKEIYSSNFELNAKLKNLLDIYFFQINQLNDKIKNTSEDKAIIYKYFNEVLTWIDSLLYTTIMNHDQDTFTYLINKYPQNPINKRFPIIEGVGSKIKPYKQVIIGIKCWLYFLFEKNKYTKEDLNSFLDIIDKRFCTINFSLNEFMEYTTLGNEIFNWRNREYEVKESGIIYSILYVKDWLRFGFIIDKLRNKSFSLESYNISITECYSMLSIINGIDKDWIEILKMKTEKELIENKKKLSQNIKDKIKSLKIEKLKNIANSNLDNEKINQFREEIGEIWFKNLFIRNIFSEYNRIEELNTKNTKILGIRGRFDDLKCKFIDNEYHIEVGGLGNIGCSLAKNEDRYFFNNLLDTRNNFIERDSLKEIIDTAINRLEECNNTTDLIFVPITYFYNDESFQRDLNYVNNNAKNCDGNTISEIKEGDYKGIPIILMNNNQLQNTVVVCDFSSAFKMKIKTKDDWYKKSLNFEVRELKDDEANNLYNENPNKWKKLDEETELNREEAILRIKNNVVIKAYTNILFEVVDEDAFVLGKLINKSI
ncbi:hypothetical protein E0494_09170 [Marinilabiliaceae bacterium JC040]|nr:hypothetical protein [Marinilabiliaceae bacterium JC040]